MALLRWLRRHRRRGVVWLVLAAMTTFLFLSLLAGAPPDAGGEGLWSTGRGRTVKLVRGDGSYRNILDVDSVNEAVEGKEDVVDAVNLSSPPPSSPSSPPPSEHKFRIVSDCLGPWPGYPECGDKIEWMREHWESDECYAKHGVNGSLCTIQIYLSEVEQFCPVLPEREIYLNGIESKRGRAGLRFEVDRLLEMLRQNTKFDWISKRIMRLWPEWAGALGTLQAQKPFSHTSANVLIHIGALSDKAGFHFAENAGKGGPLGELVQWSDLIASLYALGYNIDFSTETQQLKSSLVVNNKGGCPSASETKYTAVFVDIVGLKQLKKLTKNRFQMYKCLLRVLDTFGTEPVFNYKKWKPEKDDRNHDYGHTWGNWELNPRQFMTMYPHTPDNSFLGFVVEMHKSSSPPPPQDSRKSLVYGKELYMWKDKQDYLEVISRYFDIHATIGTTTHKGDTPDWSIVPPFVHNQGILGGDQLQQLLQESRVFVGLGFPYEGPAPLEAIAQGCVFLNPKVNPPIDRTNSQFFQKKPTNRKIDSQNPYMAMFVGEPYVYTIDAENLTEVELTLQRIVELPRPPPYIPYEFTFAGMLERITAYLTNQQYCRPQQWPPAHTLITRISKLGHSCKQTCYDEGLVCEPELFPLLNTEEAFAKNRIDCPTMKHGHSVHAPSLVTTDSHCSLQEEKLLLSCSGSKAGVHRLCPCRKYRRGQVALCASC